MKNVALTFLLSFISIYCFSDIKPQNTSVFFASDSYEISQNGQRILDSLVSTFTVDEDFEIFLEGHTDDEGVSIYNDSLSLKRVLAVKEYLHSRGLNSEQLVSSFFGEKQPELPNSDAINRSKNRRVELQIIRYSFESIEELDSFLGSKEAEIVIDPKKDNIVEGNQGSRVFFQSNSFLNDAGEIVTEPVRVSVTEALSLKDFVANNLLTVSGDKMLESGGMLKIDAQTLSGEKLELNPKKPMQIKVPNQDLKEGMTVFVSDLGADWDNTNAQVQTDFVSSSDVLVDYVPRPNLALRRLPYPTFRRDTKARPGKPAIPFLPHPPRKPAEERYKTELKWYQLPYAPIIRKKQNDNYAAAQSRYLLNLRKYEKRKKKYDDDLSQYHVNTKAYKSNLKRWNDKQISDSLNFKSSERYLEAVEKNKQLYEYYSALYEGKLDKWRVQMDSIIAQNEADGTLNAATVNTYLLSFNKLSWINIDRFYKMAPNQVRPITLVDPDDDGEKVLLVFEDIKSTLPLHRNSKNKKLFTQSKVPKRTNATLLSYKVIDGQVMVYQEKLGTKKNYHPKYKPYKFKEFKSLLENLQA